MKAERYQYKPMSIPHTFAHTAYIELGPLELSVWRTYDLKKKPRTHTVPGAWNFRIRVLAFGHVIGLDLKPFHTRGVKS